MKLVKCLGFILSFQIAIVIMASCNTHHSSNNDWRFYGGNPGGDRYSTLTQVNRNNVKELKLAWTYDTGENNDTTKRGKLVEVQPIVVNGIFYGVTTGSKLFAIDGATGKEIWKFDPFEGEQKRIYQLTRGVTYWENGKDKRIFYGVGSLLYAIDAVTGKPINSFGKSGATSLYQGLGDSSTMGRNIKKLSVDLTTPGVVYNDLIIVGSRVSEGANAAPGFIRAFNVRTGELAWTFHTIPLPGEFGYDTWAHDSYQKLGGANNWAGLVVDEKRGMVFAGTGSPSGDFYGGDRKGQNLFSNSILALNAKTGKRVWHFQTVHHDLWDLDLPTPPNLLTVRHNGKEIDAVAQATKDGFVFLFNRETGEPLFPVEEVPVQAKYALPGEHPWPTQPRPTKPRPFSMQELAVDSLTHRTPEAHQYVLDRFKNSRYEGRYTNPNMDGTLVFFIGGGAEWGGNAVTPDGVIYINSNNMLWWLKMRENPDYGVNLAKVPKGQLLFNSNCASCHSISEDKSEQKISGIPNLKFVGDRLPRQQISTTVESGRGRMPSFQFLEKEDRDAIVDFLLTLGKVDGSNKSKPSAAEKNNVVIAENNSSVPRYINNGNTQFRDQDNYPAIKPPWGLLNAVDMNTGEYLWQVPLGEYPELSKQGIQPTGTENHGGPVVTAGGLVFIAATYDEKLRAFDKETGQILWETKLPAGGFATPITYMISGKQYIAIAAGGTRYGLKSSGKYVAYSLP